MKDSKLPKTVHCVLILLVPTLVFIVNYGFNGQYSLLVNPKFANPSETVKNVSRHTSGSSPTQTKAVAQPTPSSPEVKDKNGRTFSGKTQKYIINEKDLCAVGGRRAAKVDLLLMVPSAANGFATREAIRYAHASLSQKNTANVRHLFVFGVSKDATLNSKLKAESDTFRDIVQIDIIDNYDNLTLKVISGLHWTTKFCSHAKYVIKLDTDTWLNAKKLLVLLSTPAFSLHHAVGGTPQRGARPNRDPKNKWYTSVAEFSKDIFPDYCSGPAYIMPTQVAHEIVRVSKHIPMLRMEDVYIGMCLQALKYSTRLIPGFCWWRPTGDPCKLKGFITAHNISPSEMKAAWDSKCT